MIRFNGTERIYLYPSKTTFKFHSALIAPPLKHPVTEHANSEVITYQLSEEELAKYRNLKQPRDKNGNLKRR